MGFGKILSKIESTGKSFGKTISHAANDAFKQGRHLDRHLGKIDSWVDKGYSGLKRGVISAGDKIGIGAELATGFHALSASPIGALVGSARNQITALRELGRDGLNLTESAANKLVKDHKDQVKREVSNLKNLGRTFESSAPEQLKQHKSYKKVVHFLNS